MYFLFPMLPLLPILAVYILAAVLPAAFLLRYIYRPGGSFSTVS